MSEQYFSATESATSKILELLHSELPGSRLRIKVLGGGCSGFQYEYAFDSSINEEDGCYGASNLIVIDSTSLSLLKDSVLDYQESLGQSGFVIKNPNASARCGCGNSFAI